jgi:hypothetical protein
MAANTSAERANSAARLLSSHLRQSLSPQHVQQYVVAYMATRRQKIKHKRAEILRATGRDTLDAEEELEIEEGRRARGG